MSDALLARGRRVNWVVHAPYAGFEELPEGSLPRHESFKLFRSASMHDLTNWGDWIRAYRRTLPTVMLPAVLAESYAVASALAGVHADGLRVVAWNHSDNPYDYAYLSRHEPIIHRYVVNTNACEQALLRRIWTRHRDIVLIPHGVSIGPETTRDAHTERPIRIAYGGRFDHLVKRVLDFPKLAMRLFESGVRFDLLLVGDGPQREQLEFAAKSTLQTIRAGGSNIRIEPPRPPNKMPLLWQWSDVAMLMSVHEGMSVAMLEAMAEGCVPVVTAVKSGAMDVIQPGRNGFTFPIGDIDDAVNLITKLAREPATLKQLSMAARETIATQHAFSTHVDRFMALLDEVEQSEPRFGRNAATLQMDASGVTDPGDSLTVPSDAAAKLMALLQHISNEAFGPILIYGAGRHTRALAEVWASSPVEIAAVIDDDPARHGESLWGWPILGIDDVGGLDANSVVISSWLHEEAMWQNRVEFERYDLRVYRIYETPVEQYMPAVCTVGSKRA